MLSRFVKMDGTVSFVQSARTYGQEAGLEQAVRPTLSGIFSYYYTILGALSTELKVQRIFSRLKRGHANPDLFLWMDTKSIKLLGMRITCARSLACLPAIEHAWCRAYNPEKKDLLEEIGQKLLQGDIVVPKGQEHSFMVLRARLASLKERAIVKGNLGAALSLLYQLKRGEDINVERFRHLLHILKDEERKRLYNAAEAWRVLTLVKREFFLENIRRSILLSIDPLYHKEQLEYSGQYACEGISAYAKSLSDVVEVFEELASNKRRIQNTSFTSFFLKWVLLCKGSSEFENLKASIVRIAQKVDCMDALERILSIPDSQIKKAPQTSRPPFSDLFALFQKGTRDQRKVCVQPFAEDLFAISASLFLKSSPLDLSLGRDLRETEMLFEKLPSLITYTILYLSDSLKSAQRISKFWLRVAKRVFEMGDSATAATITWVLNAPHHDRLAYDKDICLIKNYDEDFKELSEFFDPTGSFKAYRDYESLKVPCIAIMKKDLINMREHEGNFGNGGFPPLIYLAGQKVDEMRAHQENLKKLLFSKGGTNIEALLSADSLLKRSGARDSQLYDRSRILRPRRT